MEKQATEQYECVIHTSKKKLLHEGEKATNKHARLQPATLLIKFNIFYRSLFLAIYFIPTRSLSVSLCALMYIFILNACTSSTSLAGLALCFVAAKKKEQKEEQRKERIHSYSFGTSKQASNSFPSFPFHFSSALFLLRFQSFEKWNPSLFSPQSSAFQFIFGAATRYVSYTSSHYHHAFHNNWVIAENVRWKLKNNIA